MPRKTVLLYADGDFEQLAELHTAVGIAERQALAAKTASRRFGDDEDPDESVDQAKARYDAFVDEAAERAEEWVLSSIGFEAWRELLVQHPARKVTVPDGEGTKEVDHPEDAEWGLNTESFGKALLLFVDPEDDEHRTVVHAGDIAISGLGRRLRRLSAGQFEHLWATAYALNVGGVSNPKSARYSLGDPRSDET